MTIDQLAKKSGISNTNIVMIETGNRNPSLMTLAALAEALEIDMCSLLPHTGGGAAKGKDADLEYVVSVLLKVTTEVEAAWKTLDAARRLRPRSRD